MACVHPLQTAVLLCTLPHCTIQSKIAQYFYLKSRMSRNKHKMMQLVLLYFSSTMFVVVQLLSLAQLFATPWTTACQAPLSSTISQSLLRLISIESMISSKHLILCHPLLLLPSICPSIRVFSNESVLHIRLPKYWNSASASVLPMNIQG